MKLIINNYDIHFDMKDFSTDPVHSLHILNINLDRLHKTDSRVYDNQSDTPIKINVTEVLKNKPHINHYNEYDIKQTKILELNIQTTENTEHHRELYTLSDKNIVVASLDNQLSNRRLYQNLDDFEILSVFCKPDTYETKELNCETLTKYIEIINVIYEKSDKVETYTLVLLRISELSKSNYRIYFKPEDKCPWFNFAYNQEEEN